MAWARFDDRFHQNVKVLSLSNTEFRLYVVTLTYCASERSTGRVTMDALRALCRLHRLNPKTINGLVERGCLEPDGSSLRVHDYDHYLPADVRAARSAAGVRGAQARWQMPSRDDGKPMASAIEAAIPTAINGDGKPDASRVDARGTPVPSRTNPVPTGSVANAPDPGRADAGAPEGNEVQDLVAHFVRACAAVGVEPIEEQRARVGRMLKKLVASGKPPDVITGAIDRMVERNKAPEALAYLVGEIERERAGRPAPPPFEGSKQRASIADLADRYAREATA